MKPGDPVYLPLCDVPGRRQWGTATIRSVGRKVVTLDVDLADGTTERRRIPVSDLKPCGPVRLGGVAEGRGK